MSHSSSLQRHRLYFVVTRDKNKIKGAVRGPKCTDAFFFVVEKWGHIEQITINDYLLNRILLFSVSVTNFLDGIGKKRKSKVERVSK